MGRLDIPQDTPKHSRLQLFYRTFSPGHRTRTWKKLTSPILDSNLEIKDLGPADKIDRPKLHCFQCDSSWLPGFHTFQPPLHKRWKCSLLGP